MSTTDTTIGAEQPMLGEVEMVGRDRWVDEDFGPTGEG